MKKFSLIVEKKRNEINDESLLNESNLYLDFSKKYNKEHGVSGPFDKKFKGDKAAQKKYMQGLSDAWEEHKEKKGIKTKKNKDFNFKKKVNESKAIEMASQMIGDGGEPNYHFVRMSDDYVFVKDGQETKYSESPMESPLKIRTTHDMGAYTFGPFLNLQESKMFAESLDLDELNGPRTITIEDRKTGLVHSRYLTCKLQPVWSEKVESTSNGNSEQEDDEEEDDEFSMSATPDLDMEPEFTHKEEEEEDTDEE